MAGYPLVLPDMIGGNGYGDGLPPPGVEVTSSVQGAPDEEIFLRWLQANTFMPSLQFSYVPWDYSQSVRKNLLMHCFYDLSQYPRLISFLLWRLRLWQFHENLFVCTSNLRHILWSVSN